MPINHVYQGEGYAPAYQISATPFVTSSQVSLGQIKEIRFEHVTKFVSIKNSSPSTVLSVAFTKNGLKSQKSNYFFLSGSESFSADVRVDRIFVSGSSGTSNFTVVAGVTTIDPKNFLIVTGSNGHSGVG
jgi:hypothetical protein